MLHLDPCELLQYSGASMHARPWLSCVARVCGSPLQLSWAVQCSTDHVWHGGPFNRWLLPRDSTLHVTTPPILPHPLSSLTPSPPSPPILPHLSPPSPFSSLTPSPPSPPLTPHIVHPLSLSFLRCATLPSALWDGYRPCTLPTRCCSSSDSPPSQTSPGREQLVLSLHA